MMQELEKIYGEEYMKQMGIRDSMSQDTPDQPTGGSASGIGRNRSAGGFADSAGRYRSRARENLPAYGSPPRPAPGSTPSATIKLSVRLPEGVPPAADEFLRAVISNLRSSLRHAYEVYLSDLDDQLSQARQQYNYRADLEASEGGTDEAARIREQLDRVVDLSALTPEMPIGAAVETLRKSVDPPLNIVVLWTDLADSLAVERGTPINIDGMPNVKLETALDLLVKGMPSVNARAIWRIKGDAIVIATAAALGQSSESMGQPKVETDIGALAAQKNGLTNKLRDLELSLAGQDARRKAIAEQIRQTQAEASVRLARTVTGTGEPCSTQCGESRKCPSWRTPPSCLPSWPRHQELGPGEIELANGGGTEQASRRRTTGPTQQRNESHRDRQGGKRSPAGNSHYTACPCAATTGEGIRVRSRSSQDARGARGAGHPGAPDR
jgi:hypothetical protein